MVRPIHDELWSTLALARNMHGGLDSKHATTNVSTASLRLILETLIRVADTRSAAGADRFAKHVENRIETVGKAYTETHAKFAEEQVYVANKIAADEAQV